MVNCRDGHEILASRSVSEERAKLSARLGKPIISKSQFTSYIFSIHSECLNQRVQESTSG